MCGIAGFVDTAAPPSAGQTLRRMIDRIAYRGPDDSGLLTDSPVFLGHRRLSIIELSALGHQPMANEDGNCHIVYNGEIFNHAAIRPILEQAGHRYKSRSDTETILHAWEEYGSACVEHFRGMFAFAIWDRNRRQLFCARDRLGIKPFYYWQSGTVFAFASEIKALLEHPAISASLNRELVSEYLAFGYISGEETLFAGIRKLMPGHTLTVDFRDSRPAVSIRRYWDVPGPVSNTAVSNRTSGTDEDWIGELRRRLEENIEMRLMSDVPLGMFLSGGVDSSAIAALMTRMAGGQVKTFSVGYAEAAYSELAYARSVATSIGTDHHEVLVSMEDFFNALPQLVWHEDEPIAWPSSVSLYFVSRLAARHVKVVLTGEGSDELFGGYARYGFYSRNHGRAEAYKLVPTPIRAAIRSFLATSQLLRADLRRKALHTFLGRDPDIRSLYLDNFYGAFTRSEREAMVLSSAPQADAYATFLGYWDKAPGTSLLSKMLYSDQKTYLVELLMKQDQMSMACSIESRVPLLDHTLVEFAATIPDRLKLHGSESKYIFKKAVEDVLPHEIVYRAKMGFPTPLRTWLKDKRAQPMFEMLEDKDGVLADLIDPDQLALLLQRHRAGQVDGTDRLWRLLNLQLWGEMYLTGRRDRWWDGMLAPAGMPFAV
jgi:asparagine synthase (glutamine-hydrolysing)